MKNLKSYDLFETVQLAYNAKQSRNKNRIELLTQLGNEIDEILKEKSIDAKLEVFDSGYVGLKITYPGINHLFHGKAFMIFDQPGNVGREDQSMPYIQFKDKATGDEILKVGPSYNSRGFGSVQMDDDMRKKAYEDIKEWFTNNA